MEIKEVFTVVQDVIHHSIGKPKEEINMDSTLFDDLGVDSIDLVDILYELETSYDVELKVSDIEARVKQELGNVPYEKDGVITPMGINAIKEFMNEIDTNQIKDGLTVHKLVQLFSVHSLCKLVIYRLEAINSEA